MLKEFKEFAMKGNVLDMAIGVIIGGAFGKIVTSLVSDVLMPPLGLLLGKVDFSSLFLNLSGLPQPSLAAAKAAGAPTVNYGVFLADRLGFHHHCVRDLYDREASEPAQDAGRSLRLRPPKTVPCAYPRFRSRPRSARIVRPQSED